MKLDYVILADGIIERPDGKLDIYGATWDTITFSEVPAIHPQIAVALRLFAQPYETDRDHEIVVFIQGPDGERLAQVSGTFRVELAEHQVPHQPIGVAVVLNFRNVGFGSFGAHSLVLLVDGSELREPLRMEVVPARAQ